MKLGDVRPISKKLKSIILERRHIHVHLFYNDVEWHCFYFSYADLEPLEKNHWKYGPHLHYVNHLWPNLTREKVWKSFDKRQTNIPGDLHIRFIPFDYSARNDYSQAQLFTQYQQQPGYFAFALNFAIKQDADTMSVAQLATRGRWQSKVSIPADR